MQFKCCLYLHGFTGSFKELEPKFKPKLVIEKTPPPSLIVILKVSSSELRKDLAFHLVMAELERILMPSSIFPDSHGPNPLSVDSELWQVAEERTQEILWVTQPAMASELKRKEVIHHVQGLIKSYYNVEVLPFGSVPLKTYLSDGDVDVTVLSHNTAEEGFARDVYNILKSKEQDPEFEIKDVQYIQAQVKVVKCFVKDISVDISFNQTAGLSSLFLLEQVDQLIGKDHLLKRSIILIKAWCFYESRLLGAHYGLISTYGLEVLVLHIINLFHSSLSGPLAVLCKFLEYYSTFDWEKHCVGIFGLVSISSLPEIVVVEPPENNRGELLLSQDYLRSCIDMFSTPTDALENGSPQFPVKHLNILDPLKSNNNLGRSVSKANMHRIKSALSYGAKRFREIFLLPGERMGAGIENFFVNLLNRHGLGERPDARFPLPAFGTGRSKASDLTGDLGHYYSSMTLCHWFPNYTPPVVCRPCAFWPPSRVQQNCATYGSSPFAHCERSVLLHKGTDVFVARIPLLCPLYHVACGIDEKGKSRGTGTFIPDMNHDAYKNPETYTRNKWKPDSPVYYPSVKLPHKINQVGHPTNTGKRENGRCFNLLEGQPSPGTEKSRDSNCFDLKLDQFPLLPCIKKSACSANKPSCESAAKSLNVNICSSPVSHVENVGVVPITIGSVHINDKEASRFQSFSDSGNNSSYYQSGNAEAARPISARQEIVFVYGWLRSVFYKEQYNVKFVHKVESMGTLTLFLRHGHCEQLNMHARVELTRASNHTACDGKMLHIRVGNFLGSEEINIAVVGINLGSK